MATVQQPQDEEIQPTPLVDEQQPQVGTVESNQDSPTSLPDPSTTETKAADSAEDDTQKRKTWKKTNIRKKKSNADDQASDAAQWPTPEEVRNLNTSTPQPPITSEPKQPRSRGNRNSARAKKGINWKPLEVPNNHVPDDGTASAPSLNHYNGPRGKRRGGHRGGRGGWTSTGWTQQNNQTRGSPQTQQPTDPDHSTSPLPPTAPDHPHQPSEAVSPVNSQPNSDQPPLPNSTNEPRQYRNRWNNRGRGQSSGGRGGFYGPKYGSRQNDKPNHQARVPSEYDLNEVVRHQVEYYFSTDNLCKDLFLRENMDKAEGWISIYMIMNFRKVKDLVHSDKNLFVEALKDSQLVDLNADSSLIRRRGDWAAWVFPPLLSNEPVASEISSSDPLTLNSSVHGSENSL